MSMYDLMQYEDNYSKVSGSLWQYYRDESHATRTYSESFKSKKIKLGSTPASANTNDVETAVQ